MYRVCDCGFQDHKMWHAFGTTSLQILLKIRRFVPVGWPALAVAWSVGTWLLPAPQAADSAPEPAEIGSICPSPGPTCPSCSLCTKRGTSSCLFLITITQVCSHHPNPLSESFLDLKRWFWFTAKAKSPSPNMSILNSCLAVMSCTAFWSSSLCLDFCSSCAALFSSCSFRFVFWLDKVRHKFCKVVLTAAFLLSSASAARQGGALISPCRNHDFKVQACRLQHMSECVVTSKNNKLKLLEIRGKAVMHYCKLAQCGSTLMP